MKDTARQVTTLVSIIAGIVYVNLVNVPSLHLVRQSVGDVARSVPTYFFPAGYAFAIWGAIHGLFIAYAIFQMLPSQKRNPLLRKLAAPVSINLLLSGVWCWLYTERMLAASFVLIVVQLIALAFADVAIEKRPHLSSAERWCVMAPVGLNFGWVAVATIANASQFFAYTLEWDGAPLNALAWTVIMMGVAAAISVFMVVRRDNLPFGVAAAWGVIAIAVRFWTEPTLAVAALIFGIAVALAVAAHWARTLGTHRHAPLIH